MNVWRHFNSRERVVYSQSSICPEMHRNRSQEQMRNIHPFPSCNFFHGQIDKLLSAEKPCKKKSSPRLSQKLCAFECPRSRSEAISFDRYTDDGGIRFGNSSRLFSSLRNSQLSPSRLSDSAIKLRATTFKSEKRVLAQGVWCFLYHWQYCWKISCKCQEFCLFLYESCAWLDWIIYWFQLISC